ncbi:nucleoside hydrolase [Lentilactobacillus senioris]|uniref:nucleoside hydrolase n=1 Tax=Lentilactobacillus senioris TaxID=931534 RepID=UPI003D2CFA7D
MRNVYFNHDGNVDDLVSLVLLLRMPNVNLLGVGVINADGFIDEAVNASRKITDLIGNHDGLEIAASNSRPVNQFPNNWRLSSISFDALPILNEHGAPRTKKASKPAHLDMIEKINAADAPTTLVMTGPLTDLARALEVDPTITNKIDKLYWMGGTMNNKGNVFEPNRDGTAEWNAYWDSEAVQTVFDSDLSIQMIGLESTDQVPLTAEVRQHFAENRRYPLYDLIGQGYAMIMSYEADSTYYLWDVLTTMASNYPELVTTKSVSGKVITDGPAQGRTYEDPNGRPITLVTHVDGPSFYRQIDELIMK